MGPKLLIAGLFIAATGLLVYAWVLSYRQNRCEREMVRWLLRNRRDAWNGQSRWARRIFVRRAISTLRRKGLADDSAFEALYIEARRAFRNSLLLALAGGLSLAVLIVSVQVLGWPL